VRRKNTLQCTVPDRVTSPWF